MHPFHVPCPISLELSALECECWDACSCEDFCVRDHVLPLDAQDYPQTFCIEVVTFSGVTAIHNP